MPPPREKGVCKCGLLEQMADDPDCPVEFDAALREYPLISTGDGHIMIYYCPFCGGRTPRSRRSRLFHRLTEGERQRLFNLTKNLKTVDDVIAAFGEPDRRHPVGIVTITPERDGKPETSENLPLLVYTRLSETAEVYVTVHPTDRVGISLHSKAVNRDA